MCKSYSHIGWRRGQVGAGSAEFVPSGSAHLYDFQSLAEDRAGTTVTSTLQTVVYDAVLPDVAISSPADETAYAAAPEISGSAGDNGGAGLAAVRLALERADGQSWDGAGWISGTAWLTATGTSTWTCPECQAALSQTGTYSLTAEAVDRAGNAATTAARFAWSDQPITTTAQIAYAYDPLGRLVDAQYADGKRFQYAYDAAGNRTLAVQTVTTTVPLTTSYSYDAANRLTAVDGRPYTWDNNGNLLDDGVQHYRYDQADRLVAITSTTGLVWRAQYDGDGVRLRQVVNGVPITYTLDLAAPLVTVLAEQQLNKPTTYLYGLGDSPLAGDDGSAWTYLSGRDALNSVRQETDADGRVLAARSFDPYGVPLSGEGGEPFGYTGEQSDETGLAFLRARYLSPSSARFLTRDTWIGNETQPMSYNPWLYVQANPVTYT